MTRVNVQALITTSLYALSIAGAQTLTEQAELDRAKTIWETQRFTTYDFQYTEMGSNPLRTVYPWLIEAKEGQKSTAKDGNGNQILWTNFEVPDMEYIFDEIIQDQIDDNAWHLDVTYAEQGYPTSIYIIERGGNVRDIRIANLQGVTRSPPTIGSVERPNTPDEETRANRLQRLSEAQALWNSKGLLHYNYKYQGMGANPLKIAYPWSVFVRNGRDVTGNDGNGNQILWTQDPRPYTMEELFQRIRAAHNVNAPQVLVTYNKVYGYPAEIVIVYSATDRSLDFHARLYDFTPL